MELPPRKRPRSAAQRFCPHCNEIVSYKTYRSHKRLHFNIETDSWICELQPDMSQDCPQTSGQDDLPPADHEFAYGSDMDMNDESPPCSEPALSSSDSDGDNCDQDDGIEETWSDYGEISDNEEIPPEITPQLQSYTAFEKSCMSLVRWLIAFFLLLQAHFHLSDRVVTVVFLFLKQFFRVLSRISPPCTFLSTHFPDTLPAAKKLHIGTHDIHYLKFPVCKQCGSVWKMNDCVEGHGKHKKAKLCMHIPPFSRGRHRRKCNSVLLKTVELASNRKMFYPLMTYCYIDLATSLQHLLLDFNFASKCGHWKLREVKENILEDVYDGRMWKKFLNYNGKPFLDEFSFGCMINIDWFQPYKHLQYSVGAIYLTIFNLPRSLRYKLHNICLIGIIPGPREPELTINSYLDPLVQDLLKFWDGVQLKVCTGSHTESKLIRCAVICCACDIPAGRKVCGFLSHSAHLGCSRCKKYFQSGDSGLDYSGFKREEWIARTNLSHRADVNKLSTCASKTELQRKERELGCRYSSLLDLPYFDAPVMLVIDPMHNLFLGLAKHFMKLLIRREILSDETLAVVQKRITEMAVPADIGRIPYKVESSFSGFTADQYKNWVVHYSIMCMHGLLSSTILECWRHLVLACRLLCRNEITPTEVTIADALLLQFCRKNEVLFGKETITPNMHMSCHLRDCILDYGPTNHFWLFAFERFNGILGQLPNNNRSIEVQMLKKFLSNTEVMRTSFPDEFSNDFLESMCFGRNPVGSLGSDTDFQPNSSTSQSRDVKLPHSYTKQAFDSSEMDNLLNIFSEIHSSSNCIVSATYSSYTMLTLEGRVLGSYTSRAKNSSIVFAELHAELRPARINYFAKVAVTVNENLHSHVLASLSWFKSHTQKDVCGMPVTVWEHDLFDSTDFVLVTSIKCRAVSLIDKLNDTHGTALFVSPYSM